jgi:hypothetical protein
MPGRLDVTVSCVWTGRALAEAFENEFWDIADGMAPSSPLALGAVTLLVACCVRYVTKGVAVVSMIAIVSKSQANCSAG